MARKTILMILLVPLLIVMVSNDPQGTADGLSNIVRLGAELLGRAADAINQFLVTLGT